MKKMNIWYLGSEVTIYVVFYCSFKGGDISIYKNHGNPL